MALRFFRGQARANGVSARRPGADRGSSAGDTRYDAFISYSHAVDGKLAPALHRGLHRLARPWYRMRALHVFRDQTSLTVTPAL
jgi:hypothetical protein